MADKRSPSPRAQEPFELSAAEEEALRALQSMDRPFIDYTRRSNKNVVSSGRVDVEKIGRKGNARGIKAEDKVKKPSLLIKLPYKIDEKKRASNFDRKGGGKQAEKVEKVTDFHDEVIVKPWNLRPRTNKSLNANIGDSANGSTSTKAAKEKLSIQPALRQSEISEDFNVFSSLGVKSPRRGKKRQKNVQNRIDLLVPGNNLTNISADTYYVSDKSEKKQG